MPRRASNVNQADVQRIIRAHKREHVPYRMTLQPNGAAVFEPVAASSLVSTEGETETSEDVRKLL